MRPARLSAIAILFATMAQGAPQFVPTFWNLNGTMTLSGNFTLDPSGTVIADLIPESEGSLTMSVNSTLAGYALMDGTTPIFVDFFPGSVPPAGSSISGIASFGGAAGGVNLHFQNNVVDIRGNGISVTPQGGDIYTFPTTSASVRFSSEMAYQGFGPVGTPIGSGTEIINPTGGPNTAGSATMQGGGGGGASNSYYLTLPIDMPLSLLFTTVGGLGDVVFNGRFVGEILGSSVIPASLGSVFNPIDPGADGQPFDIDDYGFGFVPDGDWVLAYGSTLGGNLFDGNGDLFTSIEFEDPGYGNGPFGVYSADGQFLGSFGAGAVVDFTGMPGGGVSSFSIFGLDAGNSIKLKLGIDSEGAVVGVTAQAIPEISSALLGLCSIAMLFACRCYRSAQ